MAALMAATVAGWTGTASAAEATVGVDFASAYVFRGVTFNDGLVAQPSIEVSGLPITLGVWANMDLDDYGGTLDDGQFSEIDLYGSYEYSLSDLVGLSVGYTEYTYPQGSEADREVSLGVALSTVLSPSLTAYYGVDGGIDGDLYVEAGIEHAIALSEDVELGLSATVGYLSPDEGKDGFHNATVSASTGFGPVGVSLAYIAQLDDEVLTDESYDVEVVGTVGFSKTF